MGDAPNWVAALVGAMLSRGRAVRLRAQIHFHLGVLDKTDDADARRVVQAHIAGLLAVLIAIEQAELLRKRQWATAAVGVVLAGLSGWGLWTFYEWASWWRWLLIPLSGLALIFIVMTVQAIRGDYTPLELPEEGDAASARTSDDV